MPIQNYAIIEDPTGIVMNVMVWDGVEDWEKPEGTLIVQSDEAQVGWTYSDGKFTAPPIPAPTPEEILITNTQTRDGLLTVAALAIAPLQDAVDLDDATESETALLKKWKQFRVAVNRIDLTQALPTWPEQPA